MIIRTITVNGNKIKARVAATAQEQACGLMYEENLGKDEGMLFEYPSERILSFWMKNTKTPLSIAFIDSQGIIKEIRDMKPFSLNSIKSTSPAKWALEVNRGWFDEHGVVIGDKVNCSAKQVRIKITFDK